MEIFDRSRDFCELFMLTGSLYYWLRVCLFVLAMLYHGSLVLVVIRLSCLSDKPTLNALNERHSN